MQNSKEKTLSQRIAERIIKYMNYQIHTGGKSAAG